MAITEVDGPPVPSPNATRAERAAYGRAARSRMHRRDHGVVASTSDRPDPVSLLERQAESRLADLVPIRYGRMLVSPFTFYRGAALLMADDLGRIPNTGLTVQLCGDAHLSNFGLFGTPERRLIFDANDFDETLPGPFEWDVKRLVASLEVAGRAMSLKPKTRRGICLAAAEGYRNAMRGFADMSNLDVWYAHLDMEKVISDLAVKFSTGGIKRLQAMVDKARTRDSRQAFAKLATMIDGQPRIKADPPLVVPVHDVFSHLDEDVVRQQMMTLLDGYRATLQDDRQHLLGQYRMVDLARKVVGVGSVGTRAWIVLMIGSDDRDPLFLQAKEAQASVLEDYAGASRYPHHGQRVVMGQRLMQASSDMFLGWETSTDLNGTTHDFYIRQLRDWKGSFEIEEMRPDGLSQYATYCGWTLARAHARSGDRVAIAAYLGTSDVFAQSIADFGVAYADQNEADFAALRSAVDSGTIEAHFDL